jgi:hypothetical protein
MNIRSGIIYAIKDGKTEINYRGNVITADGVANGLDWCERYIQDNVLESAEYMQKYIDKLFGGENQYVGKVSEGVWEFKNEIFVFRKWEPEVNEDGNTVLKFKVFTLNNGLIAAQRQ